MNADRYRAAERRLWESLGASPSERRLELSTSGVSVRVQELGEGPPALFIHGGNTSGSSWASLASRLPGLRCIILDRPGTGLSEPLPGTLDTSRLIAFADGFVPDVLDALGLESAHVVATSFGLNWTIRRNRLEATAAPRSAMKPVGLLGRPSIGSRPRCESCPSRAWLGWQRPCPPASGPFG